MLASENLTVNLLHSLPPFSCLGIRGLRYPARTTGVKGGGAPPVQLRCAEKTRLQRWWRRLHAFEVASEQPAFDGQCPERYRRCSTAQPARQVASQGDVSEKRSHAKHGHGFADDVHSSLLWRDASC